MTQQSFSNLEFDHKKKVARKERFLGEMDQIIPWKTLMKAHVGTDTQGYAHSVAVTDAAVHDSQMMDELVHGEDQFVSQMDSNSGKATDGLGVTVMVAALPAFTADKAKAFEPLVPGRLTMMGAGPVLAQS
jgi:hypothetical protein